jgi:DNA polymerase-4
MDRRIVCFAIPSLEIALTRLREPSLATRPVAIASSLTPWSLLRAVSPEAEQEGMHAGMRLEDARRLCPSLTIRLSEPANIQRAEEAILGVITRYAPVWEPVGRGSWLLDVTGTARLFGPACALAATVQRDIRSCLQLAGAVSVGTNRLVAQTAAGLVGPSELYEVRPGSEQAFMAPLAVRVLPGLERPCMRKVLARLDDLNLQTLGDVADSPLDALEAAVGDYAGDLLRWAHGIDLVPVRPPATQPSVEETIVLEPETNNDAIVWGRLQDGLQRLCRRLRAERRVCRGLTLIIRHSDQVAVARRTQVHPETCWEVDLAPLLWSLLQRAFRRRVQLRLLTLRLTGLTPSQDQGELFEDHPSEAHARRERAKRLALALDQLHARFGEQAICFGRSL